MSEVYSAAAARSPGSRCRARNSECARPPNTNVRLASGRVVYLATIERMFSGKRSRGVVADQPVEVVGIEFVPAGRTEPVVAADLIDAGTVPGLKRDAVLAVDYEAASPRTAHLRAATRDFPSRNLRGMLTGAILAVAILAGFLAIARWLGRAWKRLPPSLEQGVRSPPTIPPSSTSRRPGASLRRSFRLRPARAA